MPEDHRERIGKSLAPDKEIRDEFLSKTEPILPTDLVEYVKDFLINVGHVKLVCPCQRAIA